jgi:autophagy-related protein 2
LPPITDSAVNKDEGSSNARVTAFTLDTTRQDYFSRQRKPVLEVEIHAVPMHIFIDLGQVLRKEGNWSFLSEVFGNALDATYEPPSSDNGKGVVDHRADIGDFEADIPSTSPRSRGAREKQKERQRQEDFVLKDLDPDLDYRVKEFKAEGEGQRGKGSRKVELFSL